MVPDPDAVVSSSKYSPRPIRFTFSPFAANISSMFRWPFKSVNQFKLSAIKWLLSHPSQRTITTPFVYDKWDIVLELRVLHTLHVNASCSLRSIWPTVCGFVVRVAEQNRLWW